MSASSPPVDVNAALLDRRWLIAGAAGAALLLGLVVALIPGPSAIVPVALAVAGGLGAAALLAPAGWAALRRHRGLGFVIVLIGLAVVWVVVGVRRTDAAVVPGLGINGPTAIGYPSFGLPNEVFGAGSTWPWRIGRLSLLPLILTLVSAGGGLVLMSDAVRVQVGLAPSRWAPWRLMTQPLERRNQVIWRAIPGALLIACAALLGISLADRYVAGQPALEAVVLIVIGVWAAALIASPVLVGSLLMVDRDKAGLAREEERQRFAAHLHDSVLQTLALVQRQAHDPAAVVRLARRQEYALRAWMAGESELVSETLAAALREVVANVEDEYGMTVELTAIGDRPLDSEGEALVAAAREALRNAARHAAGAPVFVFCEIDRARVEVFVRDQGPGFDIDSVAAERRGIRDAVVGRMAIVGGRATVDSTPGEGTEVALELGVGGDGR